MRRGRRRPVRAAAPATRASSSSSRAATAAASPRPRPPCRTGWWGSWATTSSSPASPAGPPSVRDVRRLVLDWDDAVQGPGPVPRAEALLFAADRAQHVATVVEPALASGAVVVSDRYVDSSVAYQGARGDLAPDEVARLSRWATDGLRPDLTVVLDVDPEVARARLDSRAGRVRPTAWSRPGSEFHVEVRGPRSCGLARAGRPPLPGRGRRACRRRTCWTWSWRRLRRMLPLSARQHGSGGQRLAADERARTRREAAAVAAAEAEEAERTRVREQLAQAERARRRLRVEQAAAQAALRREREEQARAERHDSDTAVIPVVPSRTALPTRRTDSRRSGGRRGGASSGQDTDALGSEQYGAQQYGADSGTGPSSTRTSSTGPSSTGTSSTGTSSTGTSSTGTSSTGTSSTGPSSTGPSSTGTSSTTPSSTGRPSSTAPTRSAASSTARSSTARSSTAATSTQATSTAGEQYGTDQYGTTEQYDDQYADQLAGDDDRGDLADELYDDEGEDGAPHPAASSCPTTPGPAHRAGGACVGAGRVSVWDAVVGQERAVGRPAAGGAASARTARAWRTPGWSPVRPGPAARWRPGRSPRPCSARTAGAAAATTAARRSPAPTRTSRCWPPTRCSCARTSWSTSSGGPRSPRRAAAGSSWWSRTPTGCGTSRPTCC